MTRNTAFQYLVYAYGHRKKGGAKKQQYNRYIFYHWAKYNVLYIGEFIDFLFYVLTLKLDLLLQDVTSLGKHHVIGLNTDIL